MTSGVSKSVLLLDSDAPLREVLKNFLSRFMGVRTAASAFEALQILDEERFDLVLADADAALGDDGFAETLRRDHHRTGLALLTRTPIEPRFPLLRRHDIHTVIAKTSPFNYDDLQTAVENLLFPEHAFGLGRYLRQPMQLQDAVIHTRDNRAAAVDAAMTFFAKFRRHESEITEIRLAFEELINNALYHGFRRFGGKEKYRASDFSTLSDTEQILVEYGRDNANLGVCVTDNQGSLNVDTVMEKIERQVTMEGLMDESGRGIHLTRTLCDKMIINLEPGSITQFVLLFAHKRTAAPKPLFINTVGGRL